MTLSSAPPDVIGGAADYLRDIAADGCIAVTCIVPDSNAVDAAVFHTTDQRSELAAWLQARSETAGLYYSLNEPRPGANGRLAEADVASIRGIVVDIDPRAAEEATPGGYDRERARLLSLANERLECMFAPPTAVVDSGNGVQLVWLFREPLPNTDENRRAVKAQAKALEKAYGGDATSSVDHLFRIPFTNNLPNAGKRAKGRSPTAARLLHLNLRTKTSLSWLAMIAPPVHDEKAVAVDAVDLDDFDYDAVIAAAEDPAELPPDLALVADAIRNSPQGVTALANPDRSKRDIALAYQVIEAGIVDPTAVGQITFALSPERLCEEESGGRGEWYAKRTTRLALGHTKPKPQPSDWFDGATAPAGNLPVAGPAMRVVRGLIDPKTLPVRSWLVEPRLPIGDVFQLTGEPGVSKSTFMINDALAIATGREDILRGTDHAGNPITPERLHRSGAVVVYNSEDKADDMAKRLTAAQRHHGVTADQMKHPIVLWSGVDGPTLKVMERGRDRAPLQRAKGLDLLEEVIRTHAAVLVILDPQVSLAAGAVENSNDDADAIMGELHRLAARAGVCIAAVHHTSKATRSAAGDMAAGRGAFAAVGKVRSAYTLVRCTGDMADEKALGITAADRLIRLDSAKTSHAERPNAPILLKRISVAVGNGNGSAPSSSGELFEDSPRERLEADGDRAPVLQVVDHRGLAAAAKGKTGAKEYAAREEIARIADDVLGTADEATLPALWPAMGARMREARLCKAKGLATARPLITSALTGGVRITRDDGQAVTLDIVRAGGGQTATWCIKRTIGAVGAKAA